MMQKMDCGLEIKSITDEGVIEGYGSVFDAVDLGGDRVERGAFTKSIARMRGAGRAVPMLWQHDPAQPIGVWEDLSEDSKGLWGRGRLVMEVPRARETHALMKAGALGGLSIGYKTLRSGRDGNVRVLKEVDLWEVSLVTFPMNELAKAEAKGDQVEDLIARMAAGERLTEREFEELAKKKLGLTNSQAERAARIHLKGQGEPVTAAVDAYALLNALRG